MVLSFAALIAASGGTAVAIDRIGPDEIEGDAVRSRHIKDRQVQPADLGVTEVRTEPGTVEASASGPIDQPNRPRVRINAERGDLIFVHLRAAIRRTGGTGACRVDLRTISPLGDFKNGPFLRWAGANEVPLYADSRRGLGPNVNDTIGTGQSLADAAEIPVVQSGTYRFSLVYGETTDNTSCAFRDRTLWVGLLR